MSFKSVGTNLTSVHRGDFAPLADDLSYLKSLGPGFVELWPELLGILVAGRLDRERMDPIKDILIDADLPYTVHAPLEINLMDVRNQDLHLGILEASLRFAGEIGASIVVCHAGQQNARRDALVSFKSQLAAQREALREAGDLAAESGVAVAVENYYPDAKIMAGEAYDLSVRPSELAEQIDAVYHPSVGVCLDTGHAALSAAAFGFDFFEECARAAPLVRHIHLQDNFQRVNLTGEPYASEHRAFGLGDLHLPPGNGTIPLAELFERVEFTQDPSCCAELSDEFPHLAEEALAGANRIVREALRQPLAS